MAKFDRYMLSQLLALFGFFTLVLVAVYWVNRAVGLFDQLLGDGQSALVFVEFSLLTLPNVIRLVLPISAFAGTVYVANRLSQDSELVVMQATGFSSFRLARPVLMLGLIAALMMAVLMNVLVPEARARLAVRTAEVQENITARFLRDGQFMHPSDAVTLYTREISPLGELQDVFLSDDRNPKERVTYTAKRALFVRADSGPKLIMFDGIAQTLDRIERRLSSTHFADATYDLSSFVGGGGPQRRVIEQLSTPTLLRADPAVIQETGETRAAFLQEAHSRIAQPFLAVAAPLIGFGALLLGTFSRFGLWRQIGIAVMMLILVQAINTAVTSAALRDETRWPLVYLAPLVGIAIGVFMLWLSQRPRRVGRAAPLPSGAAA